MSSELEYLSHRVATGRLTRRDFLGRAAALGVAATAANSMLANAVTPSPTVLRMMVSTVRSAMPVLSHRP